MKKALYDELPPKIVTRCLMRSEAERQEVKEVETIWRDVKPSERENAFQQHMSTMARKPESRNISMCVWWILKAKELDKADDVVGASAAYQESLRAVFGGETKYFHSEFYNPDYISKFRSEDSWKLHMDMVLCCSSLAVCYVILVDYYEVIQFLLIVIDANID